MTEHFVECYINDDPRFDGHVCPASGHKIYDNDSVELVTEREPTMFAWDLDLTVDEADELERRLDAVIVAFLDEIGAP